MFPLLTFALALAAPVAPPEPDYDKGENWLCRPGRTDVCGVDLTATVIAPDGTRTVEPHRPAKAPPIDCFYLYPTVSTDAAPNSDLVAGREEREAIHRQIARFGSVCRVFAPIYRQVTLRGLMLLAAGGEQAEKQKAIVYSDVKAAWDNYLARDNGGRGVVLIGHSQGAFALKELIAREIDGKPAQKRVVSAMLLGTNIAVPRGADVGGDFSAMPLCRTPDQTGCIVSYVSFRAASPPPVNGPMGSVRAPGMIAACTNPAALGGGRAVLDSYLLTEARPNSTPNPPWTNDGAAVETPFVRVPGLISGECVATGGTGYLAITVNADPNDPRTDVIGGDARLPGWGLHLLDVNLTAGDLMRLAKRQGAAWARRRR